jgi:hypothetical protein
MLECEDEGASSQLNSTDKKQRMAQKSNNEEDMMKPF